MGENRKTVKVSLADPEAAFERLGNTWMTSDGLTKKSMEKQALHLRVNKQLVRAVVAKCPGYPQNGDIITTVEIHDELRAALKRTLGEG